MGKTYSDDCDGLDRVAAEGFGLRGGQDGIFEEGTQLAIKSTPLLWMSSDAPDSTYRFLPVTGSVRAAISWTVTSMP